MMTLSSAGNTISTILSLVILLVNQVHGHYFCTYGRCSHDQYCCGQETCCANEKTDRHNYRLWKFWYFWLTCIIIFLLVVGCCMFYKKKRQRRSNELVVYSTQTESLTHAPYLPTTQNTHYYMAPVITSPTSPVIGQGYPQAYIHTNPAVYSSAPVYDGK